MRVRKEDRVQQHRRSRRTGHGRQPLSLTVWWSQEPDLGVKKKEEREWEMETIDNSLMKLFSTKRRKIGTVASMESGNIQ